VVVGTTLHTSADASLALTPETVIAVARGVTRKGMHSPVMVRGGLPIVDGVVTSFDSMRRVRLASYGLPLLEASGATALLLWVRGLLTA
jgi:hypothetical protein